LFIGVEKIERPRDGRAERLLAHVRITPTLQQIEPARQALEELLRREQRSPGGGELQRERKFVEPPADLIHRRCRLERGIHPTGTRYEQVAGIAGRQRWHCERVLSLNTNTLAARDDDGGAFGVQVPGDALRHLGE
jgi:hypothetical protein